ncbi:diphthine--ammonia ligase [Candidatus Pacearchaeota archaeon]|nr:diphthine--ammonia ligase [Candidatus Pacearchaeota archaeon]
MKLGILFSGGKDSTFAAYLTKKYGYEVVCLISIVSENRESFMFHTPSILKTPIQSKAMGIPLIIQKTKGEKETELKDLKEAIEKAKKEFHIEGIVTGAVESIYQASRVQKICDELDLECFNPLWQKDQFELLNNLIKNKFEIMITGVFAYPLDKSWLGRKIDKKFIDEIRKLNEKYKINPAFEGGEAESFVLNCPLFKKRLKVIGFEDFSTGENSWRREIEVE